MKSPRFVQQLAFWNYSSELLQWPLPHSVNRTPRASRDVFKKAWKALTAGSVSTKTNKGAEQPSTGRGDSRQAGGLGFAWMVLLQRSIRSMTCHTIRWLRWPCSEQTPQALHSGAALHFLQNSNQFLIAIFLKPHETRMHETQSNFRNMSFGHVKGNRISKKGKCNIKNYKVKFKNEGEMQAFKTDCHLARLHLSPDTRQIHTLACNGDPSFTSPHQWWRAAALAWIQIPCTPCSRWQPTHNTEGCFTMICLCYCRPFIECLPLSEAAQNSSLIPCDAL